MSSLKSPRYRHDGQQTIIDLRVRTASQLFDNRDAAPFRERDLDEQAADYLLTAVEEIPAREPLAIAVHVEDPPSPPLTTADIVEAILAHFRHEHLQLARRRRQQRWFGRAALVVGATVTAAFLFAAQLTAGLPAGHGREILREGLVITGWVIMWRPIEMLFYDWWPLALRQKHVLRLLTADISVRIGEPAPLTARPGVRHE